MAINFPSSLDSFVAKVDSVDYPQAIDINDMQDAVEALEAKVGIDSSGVTTSIDYKVNNFFTTGRKLWLYEDTAPTGWTIVSVSDCVLAVKGGSDAYNVTGGTTAGTWAQPTHTHTGPDHAHDMPLTPEDLGSNSFRYSSTQTGGSVSLDRQFTISGDSASIATRTVWKTYNGGTGNTGSGATASTWRPSAVVGIIVTKS